MSRHLATPTGVLCHTSSFHPLASSGDLREVDCLRCRLRLDSLVDDEDEAHHDRRRAAGYAEAAEFLGAGFLWSLVQRGDSITDRMVRDILGAVLVCLAEQHREQVAA